MSLCPMYPEATSVASDRTTLRMIPVGTNAQTPTRMTAQRRAVRLRLAVR